MAGCVLIVMVGRDRERAVAAIGCVDAKAAVAGLLRSKSDFLRSGLPDRT